MCNIYVSISLSIYLSIHLSIYVYIRTVFTTEGLFEVAIES